MSRSFRHNPFLPNTAHESEKHDKQLAHQRERKWIHDHLTPSNVLQEDFDLVNHHEHPRSGRGHFAKNGKTFHGGEDSAHRK